jgi:hypothetical protein
MQVTVSLSFVDRTNTHISITLFIVIKTYSEQQGVSSEANNLVRRSGKISESIPFFNVTGFILGAGGSSVIIVSDYRLDDGR